MRPFLNLKFVLPMMFYCIGKHRFTFPLHFVVYRSGTNRMPNVLTGHSGLLFSELNYGVQVIVDLLVLHIVM